MIFRTRALIRSIARHCHSAAFWVAAVFATVGAQTLRAQATPPATFFPIAVFSQPIDSFSKWQSLGVNTLVQSETQSGMYTTTQWANTASAMGFYQIRAPLPNAAADAKNPYLLAWAMGDEPDVNGVSASSLAAQYAALKAIDSNMPIWTNYSGGRINDGAQSTYAPYLAATDWVSNDFYVVTGYDQPTWIPKIGQVIDKLSAWSGGKPQWGFVETSNQQLSWVLAGTPGVTPDQFRAEIWDELIHGVKGITYFPQQIGNGFKYDATPANVQAEMKTQDALIESVAGALNSNTQPVGKSISLTGSSLEATWRQYDGKEYYFVLNLTDSTIANDAIDLSGTDGLTSLDVFDENRTLSLSNAGGFDDTFSPYALHIYEANDAGTSAIDALASSSAAVPEPASVSLIAVTALAALAAPPTRSGRDV